MLGLMLYIFLSAGSAHVWMGIFLAQVLVAICMATEPGQWNEWLKIWFALLTPVVLIILTGLFVMLTGYDLHIARFVREPHLPIRYVLAPP